jgi:hypothetical protein
MGSTWTVSTAAQRTSVDPCLVICPRRTVVSDSWWRGVRLAQEHSCGGRAKRRTSPISATKMATKVGPTQGSSGAPRSRGGGAAWRRSRAGAFGLEVERVDQVQQRRDAHAIRPRQLDLVEQFEAAPAEQVGHRHPHTLFGEHRVDLGFEPGALRHQLGAVAHQLAQRTHRRRSDPRLGQAAQAQQIRFQDHLCMA